MSCIIDYSMSYHSIHLIFPAKAPFDRDNWFETFVGSFVKPLIATGFVRQYWFTRYGTPQQREIRVRLTTDNFTALQPTIQRHVQEFGFTDINDEPNPTVIGTFCGARVLSPDATSRSEEDRGRLLLNIHHAISELFVECIIGPDADGRFRQEKNTDINNPHGSIFETIHHLLCNTTDVVTEVEAFKFGNNMLCLESPLYASQLKAQVQAQRMVVAEWGKFRVHF